MFFGMGGMNGHCGNEGGNGICGCNALWLLILLNCCGCNVCKDDILELLFLVMLLECFGCGCGK